MDKPEPPRCPIHKTAMVRVSDECGWIKMQCCLRGCTEKTDIPEGMYKKLYGEPTPPSVPM